MCLNCAKNVHEEFVTGHNGSSPIDIILTVLPIVTGSALANLITKGKSGFICFWIEYLLCVFPLILSFTLLNELTLELNAVMMFLLLIGFMKAQQATKDCTPKLKNSLDKQISYLTSSRSTVNLATVIAILAVDFRIFSRRFAKTEQFGYSLMDVGAACFVFMNGITDIKRKIVTWQIIKDSLILGSLGFLRFLSVTLLNYQQHVTEYGVHANFFFTLAFLKIVCFWWASRISMNKRMLILLSLAVLHEYCLNAGLGHWTFSEEPRNNIISANREWFVSMPGYIEIYLLGVSLGAYLFKIRKPGDLQPLQWSLLTSAPFIIVMLLNITINQSPSRRLANTAFVFWIVGFFLFYLSLFISFEKILQPLQPNCFIFEAINSYSLLFFLLGNICTGIINLSIDTLETSQIGSFIIINIYTIILISFVYKLKLRNVNKKIC